MSKLLCYSGGATKAVQLAVAGIETYKSGYRPDFIAGLSAGAMISLPIELGMYDEVLTEASSLTLKSMFQISPVTKKGKLSFMGWLRLLVGKHSFGVQNTRKFLTDYISFDTFNRYKEGLYADILVFTVLPSTREFHHVSIKDLDYKDFIEFVEASSHIPVMTEAVNINGVYHYDGGNWAHNPDWLVLTNNIVEPTEIISIYSREEIIEAPLSDKWKKDVFGNIDNVIKTYNLALSKCGNECTKWYCAANNIKCNFLYCPNVLKNLYESDNKQLVNALLKTQESIKQQIRLW